MNNLGRYLRSNILLILGSVFLLGSWICQNFLEERWSGEKQRLFNFLTIQGIHYTDMGQMQIAANNFEDHFRVTHHKDSINNLNYEHKYANLCMNWLQMFYDFINLSHEMTEPDIEKRKRKQKMVNDSITDFRSKYNSGNFPFISMQYNLKVRQAEIVTVFSGSLVRARLRKIETAENNANNAFLITYLLGSILLGWNFINKGLKVQVSRNQVKKK